MSDLEELASDEEEVEMIEVIKPVNQVRIGADIVHRNCSEIEEIMQDDEDEISNDTGNDVNGNTVDTGRPDVITPKDKIKWKLQPIVPFTANFEHIIDESVMIDDIAPYEYLMKYIPTTLYEQMSEKTNMYACQKGVRGFKITTPDEIKTLFGLHLVIGALKFSRFRMYWDNVFGMSMFIQNMSRNRFFQLRNNLHLVNVLEIPADNTDRFIKVRPIYDAIRQRCLQLQLEKQLCIDEQIVPFTGKLNVKQYIKGKPCPWGIKIFVLCGKSGLAYDFLLYQGSTTELNKNLYNLTGLGTEVVLHLSQRITATGHELYFDNYFSSYGLLQALKAQKVFAIGTIRINRFSNPPLMSDKDMKKKPMVYSEEVTSSDNDVVVVKWLDNKSVYLASNFLGKGQEDRVRRWDKKESKYVEIPRPEIIKRYNHSMGGVDLLDQLVALYRIFIRSKKWTLRMIFHALDLALVNSWMEYRRDCEKNGTPKSKSMDLLEFRLRAAEGLLKIGKSAEISTRRGRPSSSPGSSPRPTKRQNIERRPLREVQTDNCQHMPEHDQKKEATRCKYNRCNQRSHIYCIKCNVHLCLNRERNCFSNFHMK